MKELDLNSHVTHADNPNFKKKIYINKVLGYQALPIISRYMNDTSQHLCIDTARMLSNLWRGE